MYDGTTAKAVVTAQDTGESQTVDLTYQEDGLLKGTVTFDHVAVYKVDITVDAESFELKDSLEIQANQRGITLAGQLDKKEIDKTFKKSTDLLVSTEELMEVSIILIRWELRSLRQYPRMKIKSVQRLRKMGRF